MSATNAERSNISQRPRINPTQVHPASTSNNEVPTNGWNHLLRWEESNNSDDVIDWDGLDDYSDKEEGEHGAADIYEDFEDEERTDVGRQPQRTGKIKSDQVIDIINECIETFTQTWYPGKGEDAAHQPDVNRLWEDAESLGIRQKLVEQKRSDIEYYKERLDRLSEEILNEAYNTVDEVRRVCRNLETTVDLLEEAEWMSSIYLLEPVDEDENDDEDQDQDDDHIVGDAGPTIREAGPVLHGIQAEIIDLEPDHDGDPVILDPKVSAERSETRQINSPGLVVHSSMRADTTHIKSQQNSRPELTSIHAVSQWKFDELVPKADRKKILMKVVNELSAADRELIRTRVVSVEKKDLLMEILPCVKMWCRGEAKMRGVLPKDTYKIVAFTKLFLCWWWAGNYYDKEVPTDWRMEELANSLEKGDHNPGVFYDWLRHTLSNTFSEQALKTPNTLAKTEIIVISDDED